jgi:hypothetical protein
MAIYSFSLTSQSTTCAAIAAAALLTALGASAQEAPTKAPMAKLMQAPPGRVIFEFNAKPKAAASAPASAVTPGSTTGAGTAQAQTPAVAPAAAEEAKFDFLGSLPPPSGRPLNSARRLDAPDQGVVIKDAPKTSK